MSNKVGRVVLTLQVDWSEGRTQIIQETEPLTFEPTIGRGFEGPLGELMMTMLQNMQKRMKRAS